jgi:hypothetical protein
MTERKPVQLVNSAAKGGNGSWAPFEEGNAVAVKHGAYSETVIEAKAVQVRAELLDICPWLAPLEYSPAVARFLRAEARSLLLHEAILKQAADRGGPDKVAVRLFEQATAADRLAAQLGNTLGLDPIGRARLQQTATAAQLNALTLADLAAEGRAAMAARSIDGVAEEMS